ncbi:MAG: hypothetical protein LBQ02_01645 [Candidatus Nomurabacteria bacterium]|jgi:hypothetical protein|nr:hypothetical protein [Candidatus Nomurabacteria bacterium]
MTRNYNTWNTHKKRLEKAAKSQIFNTGRVWLKDETPTFKSQGFSVTPKRRVVITV